MENDMSLRKKLLLPLLSLTLLSGWAMPVLANPVGGGEIRVLSYNLWGLPAPLGYRVADRMSGIATALENYDVVLLQEAFHPDTALLAQKAGFPHVYHHKNYGVIQQNSGMMVLSRFPIVKTDFAPFKGCYGTDCLAEKGIFFTRVTHPQLGPVDLYNTHYQSMQNPAAANVRIRSGNGALWQMILKHQQYYPTILAGDFNLQPDLPEYRDLMQRLPLIDTWRAKHPQKPGYTSTEGIGPSVKVSEEGERIDYIFVLQNALYQTEVLEADVHFTKPIAGQMPSDHLAVYSHLRFSPVTGLFAK
jgi:endonuclease/exonuclease/phosphatase family metal-dependent hydrolase